MDDPANPPNVQATSSPVLDAETAMHIGLRAIEQRYGPAMAERHQPYEATLQREEWLVTGNPDPDGEYAKLGEDAGTDTFVLIRGSAPWASVCSKDGHVLASGLGR